MSKHRENGRTIDSLVRDYFASEVERTGAPPVPDRARLAGAARATPKESNLAGFAAAAAITLAAGIVAYAGTAGSDAPELARRVERLAVSHEIGNRLTSIVIETGRAFRLGIDTTTSARRLDASRPGGEP
jgi:hypothetical protein